MRYATVKIDGKAKWGIVKNDFVFIIDRWPSLMDALASGDLSNAIEKEDCQRVPVSEASWLPVIPNPSKIFCVGLNYENHRKETGRDVVKNPTIFTRFADSQTGNQCDIVLPLESDKLDYEGEMAVIVGRAGRRISASDAMDFVAGYSCYNDGSVRDWQSHTIQFIPGKNWPETGSFGPWMVTPDEFGELGPQRIQTRLNGSVMQEAHIVDMIFPVPKLIEYVSTFTSLSPGDVIVSGTPGGVGVKRDPQVFMKEGDQVEVEIDGIGTLTNSIARRA